MFGWFKKKPPKPQPESKWVVTLDADRISVSDQDGQVKSVARADLSGVLIETNDSGPWGADIWWLLFGSDDQLACAYPQGATGEKDLLDYFFALPAFDSAEMIKAMGSTDNAVFPVWRRPN